MSGIILTDVDTLPSPQINLREEVAHQVKGEVRQLLVDVLCDKVGHAMAVAAGRTFWRESFVRHMGAYWGNSRGEADHVADVTFQFIEKAWSGRYTGESAFAFLDAVHIPSAQSAAEREREIEDAWEVEIASSQECMERNYYGSQRVRKGRDIFSSFWMKTPEKPQ